MSHSRKHKKPPSPSYPKVGGGEKFQQVNVDKEI